MTIISVIIKSYSTILISVGFTALIIFSFGVYFILKSANRPLKIEEEENDGHGLPFHVFKESESDNALKTHEKSNFMRENLTNVSAIAGDNIITTQLDLAHACIESGREKIAVEILKWVLEQGNDQEQKEAERLFTRLSKKTQEKVPIRA